MDAMNIAQGTNIMRNTYSQPSIIKYITNQFVSSFNSNKCIKKMSSNKINESHLTLND
eukprot:jgi/Orpsp1_1/1178726/evm.model.c7180000066504.1